MEGVRRAIVAWRVWRTPAAILRELRAGGAIQLEQAWDDLPLKSRSEVRELSIRLEDAGVQALMLGDPNYPVPLAGLKSPPPILFVLGNIELFQQRAIGVCGSRAASPIGLDAARSLGRMVANVGDVLIAGNAQGVDAEAQGAALATDGGSVIVVLPDGITHLKWRMGSADPEPAWSRLLAVSQFPPQQPWSVGGAMTRNEVIISLAAAVVVIEAGERGGTLAAGQAALKAGRPVIALRYGDGTPPGNALLLRRGARPASSPREVYEQIASATSQEPEDASAQLPLSL